MPVPAKLLPGDHLRVVSPATSLHIIPDEQRQLAEQRLNDLGLSVSFSGHAAEVDEFQSSSVASRLADLHQAFADPDVNGIFTTLGGYNCNQLLAHLDYDLIAANPKVFCGFSDITALQGAILAKTGLVTYSGPHFTTFGMKKGIDYTLEMMARCLMRAEPFQVEAAETWSDDPWYMDQENREFHKNDDAYLVLQPGQAEGRLLGGNLCTFNLLHGTPYMPALAGTVLLIEDDYESAPVTFDRDLQSLCHQPGFDEVRGLLIGRFQVASAMSNDTLKEIIARKPELANMPVVANANFGHTTPQFTFPQGGSGRLLAEPGQVNFEITVH